MLFRSGASARRPDRGQLGQRKNRRQRDFHIDVRWRIGSGDPIRTDDRSGMKGKNAIAEKRSNYAKSG